MVFLPSDMIMNIVAFLGGEKYNINTDKKTLDKITRQTDLRLRNLMINDISTLIATRTYNQVEKEKIVKIITVLKRRYNM
jgi:hypothetical protein